MGLGVLDDNVLEHVPGTSRVIKGDDTPTTAETTSDSLHVGVKYDLSGSVPIILVPQPSDDPNDPLNWPLWKRDVILCNLSLLSVLASTLSSLLAANTITLSLYFGRSFQDTALLTGYHLLAVGVVGLLFVPSARVWGKRHLYLLGTVFIIFSSAWGGTTESFTALLWARVCQGIGLAPFEALVNASVGDLYCIHQRGKRMALSNMALFGGAFFTPVLVGKITQDLGWQWSFYFIAIFTGALLPAVIFYLPETAYRRDKPKAPEEMEMRSITSPSNGDRDSSEDSVEKPDHQAAENGSANATIPEKVSYWQSLLPFNGRKTDDGYLNLFFWPFPLFLHPAVLWSCLIQGTLIGWTVMIGTVLAVVFFTNPYYFTEVQTGYLYAGGFIGAMVGFLIAGFLSEWIPNRLTRLNGGIYEPEFRLPLVIVQLVLGCTGLFGFGITSDDIPRYGWFWPDFFFAFEVAGMVVGTVASALYVVDAHPEVAVEAFTCQLAFKNIFSYGLTTKGLDWLAEGHGPKHIFMILGGVQVAVCSLTLPMYVLGKRNRSFWSRHNVFFQISDAMAMPFNYVIDSISGLMK